VALKQPKDFTLIGMPARRLDSADKVNGKAEFGIDVKMSGLKFAAIAISPAFGGKVKSVNEAASRAVKGVRQIVRIDNAVAVIADQRVGGSQQHSRPVPDHVDAKEDVGAPVNQYARH
jgi:isoquinoline 1-oxidoreductase beta subunit